VKKVGSISEVGAAFANAHDTLGLLKGKTEPLGGMLSRRKVGGGNEKFVKVKRNVSQPRRAAKKTKGEPAAASQNSVKESSSMPEEEKGK